MHIFIKSVDVVRNTCNKYKWDLEVYLSLNHSSVTHLISHPRLINPSESQFPPVQTRENIPN